MTGSRSSRTVSYTQDVYKRQVSEFASLGYLYDLDGTDLAADKGDFLTAPLGSTMFNGKMYGVPQVTDSLALMYNKALLAKAGITAAPKTWDELKAAAATIKEKAGVDGVYLNPGGYFMLPFIYGCLLYTSWLILG